MIDELELRTALREIADRDEPSSAPSAGLVRRGRRARIGRAAAAFGVAGVVLAGVALLPRPAASPPEPVPVPLALAAQTTAQTTFHITIQAAIDGNKRFAVVPWEGKYDPVHDRGFLMLRPSKPGDPPEGQLQIGPICYTSDSSGQWHRSPRCWQPFDSPEIAAAGDSGSPGELLAQLKRAGNVTYAGRTGSIDSYRFTYSLEIDKFSLTKTGTVDIDVPSRRIVKVTYRQASASNAGLQPAPVLVTITLDDFGTPVDVAVPRLAR